MIALGILPTPDYQMLFELSLSLAMKVNAPYEVGSLHRNVQ